MKVQFPMPQAILPHVYVGGLFCNIDGMACGCITPWWGDHSQLKEMLYFISLHYTSILLIMNASTNMYSLKLADRPLVCKLSYIKYIDN